MDLEAQFSDISLHTSAKDYNNFFSATICHVCKQFGDDVSIKRCGDCGMVAYCGRKHQKEDWKQHKPLCKAVQNVLRDNSMLSDGRDVTSEEWTKRMVSTMHLVSSKLKRRLEEYEEAMFMFLRKCAVCYKWKGELLDCQKCFSVSFCEDHKDYKDSFEHKENCSALKLRLHCSLSASNKWFLNMEHLPQISVRNMFQDMNDYLNISFSRYKRTKNIPTPTGILYDISAAEYSQLFAYPLTVFYAMRILNYVPKRQDLVIHVIVTSTIDSQEWHVLLQLIEVTSLLIVMIGCSDTDEIHLPIADDCTLEKKNISFQFYNASYEGFADSPLFVKPDLVVGFNVHLCSKKREFMETRVPCVKLLSKENCPFILTSVTNELEQEVDQINAILGRKVDYLYYGKNPFASLMPLRIPFSERVFYENRYILVYGNLCL